MSRLALIMVALVSGCSLISVHKLTSNLRGVVLVNGEPVSDATVIFKARSDWYGEWQDQTMMTANDGQFEMPQWRKVRPFVLVHQPVIEQEIVIIYQSKEYLGWRYTRLSYSDSYDEANDSVLQCDLTSPVSNQKINGSITAKGICQIKHD